MKTFTCSSMGGPSGCMFHVSGSTPEELLLNGTEHIKQMSASGDAAHMGVLEMMTQMENTTEGSQWNKRFLEIWDAKTEDQ